MAGEQAIFITGGASGIGQAVAKLFAARGWRVGLADVNAAGLEATRAMLPPGMASVHVMDVRDREAWAAALRDFTQTSGGRLDVLFNNAGITRFATDHSDLDALSAEDFQAIYAVNVIGAYQMIRACRGQLEAAPNPGAVVNVSDLISSARWSSGIAQGNTPPPQ